MQQFFWLLNRFLAEQPEAQVSGPDGLFARDGWVGQFTALCAHGGG